MNGCRHLIRYGLLYCTLQGLLSYVVHSRGEGPRVWTPSKIIRMEINLVFHPLARPLARANTRESSNAIQSVTFQYSMTLFALCIYYLYSTSPSFQHCNRKPSPQTLLFSASSSHAFAVELPHHLTLSSHMTRSAMNKLGVKRRPAYLLTRYRLAMPRLLRLFLNFSIDCDPSLLCLASSSYREVDLVFSYFHHVSSHPFL
jgi:hypothetical protein